MPMHWLLSKPRWLLVLAALLGVVLVCALSLYVQWRFHVWWSRSGPALGLPLLALALNWKQAPPTRYLAFISHRRKPDRDAVLLIQGGLAARGFRAFIDVNGLQVDRFDEQLLREIESARYFIIILSPEPLARCSREDDWMRRELAHALQTGRKIIPPSCGKDSNLKIATGCHHYPKSRNSRNGTVWIIRMRTSKVS